MSDEHPAILVVGGTGVIGSELLPELNGAGTVRALAHTEASAQTLARCHPNVELVRGDLADPRTLEEAFEGMSRLFLLTPSVAEQQALEENALTAARDAGIERIVYLSNNEVGWGIELSRAHRLIETTLARIGVPYTALRPDYLFDNLLHEVGELAQGRIIAPSSTGRCAFVDARDVGSLAAVALVADEPLESPLAVTGPELLSWAGLAGRLSDALEISIEHVDPDPAEWEELVIDAGMPAWLAGALREYFERLPSEAPVLSDDVIRVTGKAPRSVEEFARDRLAPALDDRQHFATTPRRREHA